ncbi:hypothetical protein [Wielerella bovis]|uniref:hypothetical protein n=1 Tax=Wielerella bovis TaxID=2917790 RepID=UPI00201A0752|nr:hypothetical protein [Wielerella bovis]ULJ61132.1 hypothetical protein MIS44_04580 [Wielerella bovis]
MDIWEIVLKIFLYGLGGILALSIIVGLLKLLFEFIYWLPEIVFMILFLMAFGTPIYLAFEMSVWWIALLPFTLGTVCYLHLKWEDFTYQVRQEMKRKNQAASENHDIVN